MQGQRRVDVALVLRLRKSSEDGWIRYITNSLGALGAALTLPSERSESGRSIHRHVGGGETQGRGSSEVEDGGKALGDEERDAARLCSNLQCGCG